MDIVNRLPDGTAVDFTGDGKILVGLMTNYTNRASSVYKGLAAAGINVKMFSTDKLELDSSNTELGSSYKATFPKMFALYHALNVLGSVTPAPVPMSSGNYKFKIEPNGDVVIMNDAGKVALSVHPENAGNAITDCGSNSDCVTHYLKFFDNAWTSTGNIAGFDATILHAMGLAEGVGKTTGAGGIETAKDKEAVLLANYYGLLRKINWRAYADGRGVFELKDYTKEHRADDKVANLLALLTDGDYSDLDKQATAVKNVKDADDSTWVSKTFLSTSPATGNVATAAPFADLVSKAIKYVNANKDILTAQGRQNFFSKAAPRSIPSRGKVLAGLVAQPPFFSSVFPIGGKATLPTFMIGGEGQVGGGDDTKHSRQLRAELSSLVGLLNGKGKRLSPPTFAKFEQKLQLLENAEKEVNAFMEDIKRAYKNGGLDAAAPVLNDTEIKNLNAKSASVAKKVWVLSSGLSNIKLRLHEHDPQPSGPGSYSLI